VLSIWSEVWIKTARKYMMECLIRYFNQDRYQIPTDLCIHHRRYSANVHADTGSKFQLLAWAFLLWLHFSSFWLTMANQPPSQGILVEFLKWLLEFSTIYILFCKHQLDRVACLLCGTVPHEKTLDTHRAWLEVWLL